MGTVPKKRIGAPRSGGAEAINNSGHMCEPMETVGSLGDDTHVVLTTVNGQERGREIVISERQAT